MTLQSLIDKQDSFEIVRDQIAGILLAELANQQALAPGSGKDPLDYTLSVYLEQDAPIEKWLNAAPERTAPTVPAVSISLENSTRNDKKSSVPAGEQVYDCTYLLDVLARGVTTEQAGAGHVPADKAARLNCHAAVRLVRNILSATENRRLKLNDIVHAHVHFRTMEYGQAATFETQPNFSVWAGRCRFSVTMTELSPEYEGVPLEIIRIAISDDGGVVLETEVDTT